MIQSQNTGSESWLRGQRHRVITVLLRVIVFAGPLGMLPDVIDLLQGEGFSLTLIAYAWLGRSRGLDVPIGRVGHHDDDAGTVELDRRIEA